MIVLPENEEKFKALANFVVENATKKKITRITFGEWFDGWILDNYPAIDTPEGRTHRSYEQIGRDYIKPKLGSKLLTELSRSCCHDFTNWLKNEAVSPKTKKRLSQTTQAHVTACLKKCLADAVVDELIDTNPISPYVIPLPKESNIPEPYTEEELLRLCSLREIKNYPLIVTLALTAARPGELLAVPWRNLNLDARKLLIDRELEPNTLQVKMTTKNKRRRTIDLFKFNCTILKEYGDRCKYTAPDDLIFPAVDGSPARESDISSDFQEDIEKFGLRKIRMVDLRYSCITWLINKPGVPIKVVQQRAGHASASMTLDRYGHYQDGVQRDVIRKLDSDLQSGFEFKTASCDIFESGTPGATRTPDTRFRKPLLCPPELLGHAENILTAKAPGSNPAIHLAHINRTSGN